MTLGTGHANNLPRPFLVLLACQGNRFGDGKTTIHISMRGHHIKPQGPVRVILALGNNTEHVISYEMPVEIAS